MFRCYTKVNDEKQTEVFFVEDCSLVSENEGGNEKQLDVLSPVANSNSIISLFNQNQEYDVI
jgi:hypothetical protein